jgi:hypothetical protein
MRRGVNMRAIAGERRPDPFMGEAEVMIVLGFDSEGPIRRAVREGQIPRPIVVGRRRYWLRAVWERFLQTGEIGPPNKAVGA